MAIRYQPPASWMQYDTLAIQEALANAKAAVMTLANYPYQREWVEHLQEMELKREVAGTSRIEGAEFSEQELNEALADSPEELLTRSQRQARAAVRAYRWIATLPLDLPVNRELILDIHRHMVLGADDDHCPPGTLRTADQNVTFGMPRHRGVNGGRDCEQEFSTFTTALQREFPGHDPLLQAMAAHYHLAAMHPFLDGNGRTARALEALLLQRAGLRETCFIAMSNYYYDEKPNYLKALAEAREKGHDLTPFFLFALKGLTLQVERMLRDLKRNVQKALFRNTMFDLFKRLESPRKRVLAERQLDILKILLKEDSILLSELFDRIYHNYKRLKNTKSALVRDVLGLRELGAIRSAVNDTKDDATLSLNLDWPSEITENDFMERIKNLPKAKTSIFLP